MVKVPTHRPLFGGTQIPQEAMDRHYQRGRRVEMVQL